MNRPLKKADGYVAIARGCGAHPELAQELDESYRRMKAELDGLLDKFPDSKHCQEESAHKYRLWAFVLEPFLGHLPRTEMPSALQSRCSRRYCATIQSSLTIGISANTYTWHGEDLWRLNRLDVGGSGVWTRDDDLRRTGRGSHASRHAGIHLPARLGLRSHRRVPGLYGPKGAGTGNSPKAKVLQKLSADPSAAANFLYFLALAQARVGDGAGYRATCKALMDLPIDKISDLGKSRPIWTSCWTARALEDPKLPVKLAEEYLATLPTSSESASFSVRGHALSGRPVRTGGRAA